MLEPAPTFSLGVYVFEQAEVLDFAAPYGVFSIAGHLNPQLEVVLVGESLSPVTARAGFTVVPARSLENAGSLDAFLLPGGPGARREMHNTDLHRFISQLPQHTLLASVCSGALILGQMGLLDGLIATSRKEPDPGAFSFSRTSLLDQLAQVAPRARMSSARLVDSGRMITSGGAAAGLDLGFHLLRRAGHDEAFVSEVARVMDYTLGFEMYLEDIESSVVKAPPGHPRETERLEALRLYRVLNSEAEKMFDDLARLASMICDSPISLVSLVDEGRQWFKARIGMVATETSRDVAFCAHAILQDGVMIVPDALADVRFADNPLVLAEPHIRFYAGAPLVTSDGFPIGTLCVFDRVPRQLRAEQVEALEVLRAGYRFLRRLLDEWDDGLNKFDGEGEGLFGARVENRFVGVCGLNVDPYAGDASVGRVRHLYVLGLSNDSLSLSSRHP